MIKAILESIIINHKGQKVSLRKIAQVSVKDAHTFVVNVADDQVKFNKINFLFFSCLVWLMVR